MPIERHPDLDPELAAVLALLPEPPADRTPAEARAEIEASTALLDSMVAEPPMPAEVEDLTLGATGLAARRYRPDVDGPHPTLVYLHGGGWVVGSLDTHHRMCAELCVGADVSVLSVDYRLAPEHPFPAAFDDGLAATGWAADHLDRLGGAGGPLAVGGDSAGGNLAAAVALAARDGGGPELAAQILVYPTVDLAGRYADLAVDARYPSRADNAEGYFLSRESMRWYADHYVPAGADATDRRASPLRADDLAGLPPALVVTAGFDPLRDEGDTYARLLEAAGVEVVHRSFPTLVHGFQAMGPISAAAQAAVDAIVEATRLLLHR